MIMDGIFRSHAAGKEVCSKSAGDFNSNQQSVISNGSLAGFLTPPICKVKVIGFTINLISFSISIVPTTLLASSPLAEQSVPLGQTNRLGYCVHAV